MKIYVTLQTILQDNPELQIINWFADDLNILQIDYWENKLADVEEVEARAKSFGEGW